MSEQSKFGRSSPLGATVSADGANFSVFSSTQRVELCSLIGRTTRGPARVISIDPATNRTYHYWHVFVPGVQAGQLYGYRVQGPFDPASGMRFDPTKVLLDPYGRGVVVPKNYSRDAAQQAGDNAATAMKSVVVDPHAYDWEGDTPLQRPSSRTIIYEMHVRGFTRHPSSGVAENKRGTYAGLIEKIPYLQELGITAVELLPVFQFDPQDAPPGWSTTGAMRRSRSLRRTRPTVRGKTRSARWMSFATWSRRCTGPASKSFSTWCSITPPKATTTGRR